MLRNYLVSAWRNLKRQKSYAFVTVFGLSLGVAAALFVVLLLRSELSYDRHFRDSGRIFRVVTPEYTGGPYVLSRRLLDEVPEVEEMCAIKQAYSASFYGQVVLTVDGRRRLEGRLFHAEPSFFRLFDSTFIHGRPETALAHPRAVVLTRRAALRYFGTTECLGRIILYEDKLPLQIEGVIENPPGPTHFRFNMLVPVAAVRDLSGYEDRTEWGDWNYKLYLLVSPGASPRDVERKLAGLFPEDFRREKAGRGQDPAGLRLQRLTDIHLFSHLRSEFEANGDVRWLLFFSTLGVLVLGVSVLNYVNLATAQALRRNREVGLRKVLGAGRKEIAAQHMGEAFFLTAAAALLGLGLFYLASPLLGSLAGSSLGRRSLPWGFVATVLPALAVLVGLAAGSYPSFFASSLRPLQTLKGSGAAGARRFRARSLILGFQFMVSVGFITAAFIIFAQMNYLRTKDLGLVTDKVINIRLTDALREKTPVLKRELLSHPGILTASASSFLPGENELRQMFNWEGRRPDEDNMLRWIAVDADFVKTFDLRILEGEGLTSWNEARGEWPYLVNESAVKRFGWDSAVGKRLEVQKAYGKATYGSPGRVVGMVKDFHFRPLHYPVEPLALVLAERRPTLFRYISVKVSGRNLPATVRFIDDFCARTVAEGGGAWSFFDDEFGRLYRKEIQTSRLLGFLAALVAGLAGLGVFGLTAFMVESRRKEISIRKVLGADALRVLSLFSLNFLRTMTVGAALAAPAVTLFARKWLGGFAYRIALGPWFFAGGLALMAALVLAAVSWHTARAANADPAVVLRTE